MLARAVSTAVRRAVLHAAAPDVLQMRSRFERALEAVDWSPPGLAPDSILLVRQLAVRAGGTAAAGTFAERTSRDLQRMAAVARRPWIDADTASAPAVFFADEAELAACLVRDWLHGLAGQRWWWRTVLRGRLPLEWIRQDLLGDGERLPAVMQLLALHDEVARFGARIEPADCQTAIARIARAHAIDVAPHSTLAVMDTAFAVEQRRTLSPRATPVRPPPGAMLQRLQRVVPESCSPGLQIVQRRLVAVALVICRAASWARTPGLAVALESLSRSSMPADASRELPSPRPPKVSTGRNLEQGSILAFQATDAGTTPSEEIPASPASLLPLPTRPGTRPALPPTPARAREPPPPIAAPRWLEPDAPPTFALGAVEPRAGTGAAVSRAAPAEARAAVAAPYSSLGAAPAPLGWLTSTPCAKRTPTAFGGLFYLLNAAIAMGIYSDFSAPLGPNLALSPWDWLATAGREWFGTELLEDPVDALLAELAGRNADESPERDFELPHQGWRRMHFDALRDRLELAVGVAQAIDVPAFVCRYPAAIEVTPIAVHLHLTLATLPIAIRIAGLDRDPGWIPAAGREVRFHFE